MADTNPTPPTAVDTIRRRGAPRTKRVAVASISDFASESARVAFYMHLEKAQDERLQGNVDAAQVHCLRALRLKSHPAVFSVLEEIAEQRGDFPQAREFRLLHAFMARDPVMWKQLYLEYMNAGEFHRAVLCLKRLTALSSDPAERRQLILDRADLLVGLGETKQACTAYEELWRKSNYRDFEVFALLSALYFQLGRRNALQATVAHAKSSYRSFSASRGPEHPATETVTDVKGFITLLNVECELFLERGFYDAVVKAVVEASRLVGVAISELHPDVLSRYAIAQCLLGERAACLEAVEHIIAPEGTAGDLRNSIEEFGDTLFDIADALLGAGWFEEAERLLGRLLQAPTLRIPALNYCLGRAHVGLGNLSDARDCFTAVLTAEPRHARSRVALASMALEIGDFDLARSYVQPRTDDDNFDAVLLHAKLSEVEFANKAFVAAVVAGNEVLRFLEVTADDEESIATGASKRRSLAAYVPSIVRASSAIVPASSLSAVLGPASGSSVATSSRVAASISASFVAASVARSTIALAKRTSIAASSVAASSIASQRQPQAAPGEIFRFHKTRRRPEVTEGSGKEGLESPPAARRPPRTETSVDVARLDDLEGFDEGDDAATTDVDANRNGHDMDGFALPDLPSRGDDAGINETPPSLDAIAATFDDPEMAALFIQATSGRQAGADTLAPGDDLAALTPASNTAGAGKLDELAMIQAARVGRGTQVCANDVIQLLGFRGVADVALRVTAAYEALGQLTEAKDITNYCRVTLGKAVGRRDAAAAEAQRQMARIHVRLSAETGDPNEGLQNAVKCLVELGDRQPNDSEVVMLWHLVNTLQTKLADKSKILNRFAQSGAPHAKHPLLAVVMGNRALHLRTFTHAFKLYWSALPHFPQDACLHLLLAICYAFLNGRKGAPAEERHLCASHAGYFLQQYVAASVESSCIDPLVQVEVAFNSARLFHYLWLPHLAIPLYQQCARLCCDMLRGRAATANAAGCRRFDAAEAFQRASSHGEAIALRDGNLYATNAEIQRQRRTTIADRSEQYNRRLRATAALSI